MSFLRVNKPHVIHEIIDGEAVLVNMENGSYYSIDSVGAVIWKHLEAGLSADEIVAVVSEEYEGDDADIRSGVDALLKQFQEEGLLVSSDQPAPREELPQAQATGGAKPKFAVPALQKYTDMEDLLLLDPIHDVDESGWPNTNPNAAATHAGQQR